MFSTSLIIFVLGFVLAGMIAREFVKWYLKVDESIVKQRRDAQDLAKEFHNVGLSHIGGVLNDAAVGALGDMFEKIHNLAVAVKAGGKDVILRDCDRIFLAALHSKLSTPEGRAYIAVLLAEATPAKPAAPASTPALL